MMVPRRPIRQRRYKLANWQASRIHEDKPGDDGGMWVGFSPDGERWTGYDRNPVLSGWPEGYGKFVPYSTQDVIDVFYDRLQKQYCVALKVARRAGGWTGPRTAPREEHSPPGYDVDEPGLYPLGAAVANLCAR